MLVYFVILFRGFSSSTTVSFLTKELKGFNWTCIFNFNNKTEEELLCGESRDQLHRNASYADLKTDLISLLYPPVSAITDRGYLK